MTQSDGRFASGVAIEERDHIEVAPLPKLTVEFEFLTRSDFSGDFRVGWGMEFFACFRGHAATEGIRKLSGGNAHVMSIFTVSLIKRIIFRWTPDSILNLPSTIGPT